MVTVGYIVVELSRVITENFWKLKILLKIQISDFGQVIPVVVREKKRQKQVFLHHQQILQIIILKISHKKHHINHKMEKIVVIWLKEISTWVEKKFIIQNDKEIMKKPKQNIALLLHLKLSRQVIVPRNDKIEMEIIAHPVITPHTLKIPHFGGFNL